MAPSAYAVMMNRDDGGVDLGHIKFPLSLYLDSNNRCPMILSKYLNIFDYYRYVPHHHCFSTISGSPCTINNNANNININISNININIKNINMNNKNTVTIILTLLLLIIIYLCCSLERRCFSQT